MHEQFPQATSELMSDTKRKRARARPRPAPKRTGAVESSRSLDHRRLSTNDPQCERQFSILPATRSIIYKYLRKPKLLGSPHAVGPISSCFHHLSAPRFNELAIAPSISGDKHIHWRQWIWGLGGQLTCHIVAASREQRPSHITGPDQHACSNSFLRQT